MKGGIGMANYEKQVEQEAAYPIPISLYNCYRTVRHEKRYQEYICSTMRGRIKGTDSTINAILATAVLYELRWKIWNGAE